MIEHRLKVMRLQPIYEGVYAVGHSLLRPNARYLAAILSYPERAVLSHGSAAALLGIRPSASARIEVTLTCRASGRPSVTAHETRSLHPDELTTRDGIPCTSVARTIVDVAGRLVPAELRRTIERSEELNLFDGSALDAVLARSRGRRGVRALRRILAELPEAAAPVRSELERRFLDLVRQAGLPIPVVNARVAGHEVDFHWPPQRLIVETDGRATHDTAFAFERDRARDLDLHLAGWQVVRLTWSQVTLEPDRVTAMLRAGLD